MDPEQAQKVKKATLKELIELTDRAVKENWTTTEYLEECELICTQLLEIRHAFYSDDDE